MTMLSAQQPTFIDISERTACADHFVLPRRCASAKLPTFEPIPRVHAPAPSERSLCEKRSSCELGDQTHILAPCPKKPAVVYSGLFFAGPYQPSPLGSPSIQQNGRGLWAVPESATEEVGTSLSGDHEANHLEADACAELLEIMSNSRGSSPLSSKANSPSLPSQFSPDFDEAIDDYVAEPDYLPESTHAVPIPAVPNARHLMVDDFNASPFGKSPIVRTRNPLPNDSSFSPAKRDSFTSVGPIESMGAAHALPLSHFRRILGETDMNSNVIHHSKLCDAVSEMHVASKSETRRALGGISAAFAVRPRSYSVGDKRNNFVIAL